MNSSLAIIFLSLASATGLVATDLSITEFSPKDNERFDWRIVDDGVMGGLSKGKITLKDDGILKFDGTLSLENNGGFSSLRSKDIKLDLTDFDGLKARVRGDGRSYQLRLGTDARFRGMEISFMAEFHTTKGKWTEVTIPFDQLVGSFRGMTLEDESFDASKVRRLGLLLGDKKTGPFKLEVDWIRAYREDSNSILDLAVADGRFKTLATALTEADLLEALNGDGPFTVFAPTDEAFAKLPKGTVEKLLKTENREQLQSILKHHVTSGSIDLASALSAGEAVTLQGESLSIRFEDGRMLVGDATIRDADIKASNGVIHVIDSVLLPPSPPAPSNLLNVAKEAGSFTTLLAAIEAAGLTPALEDKGPLTVFAPTDEAFAKLPKGTVASLLKPENKGQLKALLALHATGGRVSAGDALNAEVATALNGEDLRFQIQDGVFKVNDATIRQTDINCENGVIHVIDSVLLPPSRKSDEKSANKDQSAGALARIEAAIEKGVPVFNKGQHEKCADIYKACIKQLVADTSLSSGLRAELSKLMQHAEKTDDPTSRAWAYRRCLDHAYERLVTSRG
jgi:uncharacterized surface protein with fasciclin (FAS1) repeats